MGLKLKSSLPISEKSTNESLKVLLPYVDQLKKISENKSYDFPESSICLPFDDSIAKAIGNLKNSKVSPKLKYVVNIGIGGSHLGAKAIYDSLLGSFDILEPNRFPKMISAETNDPESLEKISSFLSREINDPQEILLTLVSKSGSTTESISNFEIINQILQSRFGNINERYVVISDEGSKLWNKALEKNIATLPIPKNIGGRYSVFSSVGLFPLTCVGINIEKLLLGAKKMRDICLSKTIEENPAMLSAALLFEHLQKGIRINDNFIFHPELESIGKWYRQLMGESIGKEKDLDGQTVNQGITPTVSIGSTDLHSMGQLYLGGPKNKITTFIYANSLDNLIKVPGKLLLEGLVEHINEKSPEFIMKAILNGVKIAYEKKKLPYMEVLLDDVSESSLGEFLQFKMIEMMFLAKLMNVNAFDQPNVEDYKVETRKILSGQA